LLEFSPAEATENKVTLLCRLSEGATLGRKMFDGQVHYRQRSRMFETIFMAGLLVSVPASLPVWPYSRRWGFKLSVILGVLLVALLILSVADPNF
jgi:Protein of unknown function (DUF3309)